MFNFKILLYITSFFLFLLIPQSQSFWSKLTKGSTNLSFSSINLLFRNQNSSDDNNNNTDTSNDDSIIDGSLENLDFPQITAPLLIERKGYPVEVHHVTTEDGYILELHRIPHGKVNASSWRDSPVLVMHGYACTSINWLLNTANMALPYKFSEDGYDVWLGNFRGNKYSNRHLDYGNNDTRFWNFSWHEMGMFDIPSMIDYILKETEKTQIFYVGHSMGSTAFFVTMSMRTEYNDKIKAMAALAPVAYFHQLRNTTKLITPFVATNKLPLNALGHGELFPAPLLNILKSLLTILCDPDSTIAVICDEFLRHVARTNPNQLNKSWLPLLFDSTSTRTLLHFVQEVKSGIFSQYDYGVLKNFKTYGRLKPPPYNLSKVVAPVALYWSSNDWLASPEDVQFLAKKLPNVIVNYRVPSSTFSHLEFLSSMQSEFLYDVILYNITNAI